jgi:hypothetical protein
VSWEKVTLRGIDSRVGGIRIDAKDTVYFDMGRYSNNLSGEGSQTTVEVIDGYEAKIVSPRNSANGITGVYIDSLFGESLNRTKFNLYGRDLSSGNQDEFLKAIRTLKFKRQN